MRSLEDALRTSGVSRTTSATREWVHSRMWRLATSAPAPCVPGAWDVDTSLPVFARELLDLTEAFDSDAASRRSSRAGRFAWTSRASSTRRPSRRSATKPWPADLCPAAFRRLASSSTQLSGADSCTTSSISASRRPKNAGGDFRWRGACSSTFPQVPWWKRSAGEPSGSRCLAPAEADLIASSRSPSTTLHPAGPNWPPHLQGGSCHMIATPV